MWAAARADANEAQLKGWGASMPSGACVLGVAGFRNLPAQQPPQTRQTPCKACRTHATAPTAQPQRAHSAPSRLTAPSCKTLPPSCRRARPAPLAPGNPSWATRTRSPPGLAGSRPRGWRSLQEAGGPVQHTIESEARREWKGGTAGQHCCLSGVCAQWAAGLEPMCAKACGTRFSPTAPAHSIPASRPAGCGG